MLGLRGKGIGEIVISQLQLGIPLMSEAECARSNGFGDGASWQVRIARRLELGSAPARWPSARRHSSPSLD